MALERKTAATLSVRFVWPFTRLYGGDPRASNLITSTGVSMTDFANPETRILHSAAMTALELAVTTLNDPLLGLRAGKYADHAQFDILEYAARSAGTLGDALKLMNRYLAILHDGAESSTIVQGEHALWRFRFLGAVRQPPAANDFVVSSAIAFTERNVPGSERPLEVHLMHERPPYAAEVECFFDTKVTFGAPYNAVVIHRDRLNAPMLRPSASVSAAFEQQAQRILQKMREEQGLVGRVRVEVAAQLCAGDVSMRTAARRLGLGVATLRRRLEEEGTTFSAILDNLRKGLAEEHLSGSSPTVSEVAFQLGFSNVRAFGRAFRRWTGKTPTEYRADHGR